MDRRISPEINSPETCVQEWPEAGRGPVNGGALDISDVGKWIANTWQLR